MIALSKDPHQRIYYENQLKNEIKRWNYWRNKYNQQRNLQNIQINQSKITNEQNALNDNRFTVQELAYYDGTNGKPAYVAVNGIVYDVSLESTWGGATHFGLYAGMDLSDQFNCCHSGMLEVLRNLPQVGVLQM